MYMCVCVYIYMCVSVYMYMCVSVYMYMCVSVYMYMCVSVYMYVCVFVCVCVHEPHKCSLWINGCHDFVCGHLMLLYYCAICIGDVVSDIG